MKRSMIAVIMIIALCALTGCTGSDASAQIVATTLPVYDFSAYLCQGTPLTVGKLVNENISCLHDYTLTVSHMRMLEAAEYIVISGGGLEAFLDDALPNGKPVIDASRGIELLCPEEKLEHDHGHEHHHEFDPHFWLSPNHAKEMAQNIYEGLCTAYPIHSSQFSDNLKALSASLDALSEYAESQLLALSCRDLITFHDGFSYMAKSFDLHILHSVEEESGSESSAKDLIHICKIVSEQALPAVFTESNGSTSAAEVICSETGVKQYSLDMAIAGDSYFDAMYRNIDTLKEALE